ncbi:hypothetical protein PVAND_004415 [Polypedilum vanderplanki]|uniref:Uncharacterized protein n=1 Tax=Polypedilum vanderplanki TaxID=319348 RepID=A0A9J6BX29_POLVA|nr:hypothetical protein PVAND_004415 [Polypedilum vanderplanki]
MFFRRAFGKNQNDYSKETFEEIPNREYIHTQSPSSPPPQQKHHWQMKSHYNNKYNNSNNRRGSFGEREHQQIKTSAIHVGGGLSVLQLTPIWEHIIRTNSLPNSININELFEEFYARLHDPEISVRSHALRVLVDVLIVMGQQADYHVGSILHPLVDNLGHIAPAVRKSALDALRVYVAQSAMPETVMLDIMNYGMNRPANDPFSGRLTVAIMLALPALILPILITPKRSYVVKAVIDALSSKMVQITYQEIALKILLKIKDMVGLSEFHEYMPINVKKDFDLLCKVYGLPKTTTNSNDSNVDLHVPAYDPKKPWASKFVPKKNPQGNYPTSHAPIDSAKYFGANYDATYPFERTRLSNNLGTPKKVKSPRQNSAGIMRASSEHNLSVECNGNSSGSESGGSSMSLQTQTNTAANSKVVSRENGFNGGEKKTVNGKVIMETEIKITPETAVTMRILEQNPSTQTDESDDENGNTKKIITDFSAPYPVTPMKAKNQEDLKVSDNFLPKNGGLGSVGRRVRFGGEIIKMRTPDSDTVDQSDDNDSRNGNLHINLQKENSNLSDNSSISSDNSTTNEYIKQANVGFMNEPLSLNQLRNNIGQLKKEKKAIVEPSSFPYAEPTSFSRATPMNARPVSSRPPPVVHSPPNSRPNSSSQSNVEHTIPITTKKIEPTVKLESSSSTDYSQELNIRIPENETVLPAYFTPPNIMIKKNSPMHHNGNLLQHQRPATSPMVSPKIFTIPATSSSSYSSKNNSPIKSAPVTPNYHSPSKTRQNSVTPEKIRRSVSSLSPRSVHHGVTMLHNLTRSPGSSPLRHRRSSMSAEDIRVKISNEENAQTVNFNPKLDEMTQTPNSVRADEMTQTSIIGDLKCTEMFEESTPSSMKDSPGISVTYHVQQQQQPEFKSWEELGIVDYYTLKDLKSGVSIYFYLNQHIESRHTIDFTSKRIKLFSATFFLL